MSEPTESPNKRLVRDYHAALWGGGDLSAIDRYWHPDAVVHMTGTAENALDAVKADAARYGESFADVTTEIRDLLGDGEKVALYWATTGTHVGRYGVVEPTGKRITMTGVDILTVRDGRFVEVTSMWDGLDVFDQLGVLPPLY